MNYCVFNDDRSHRYLLRHAWDLTLPCVAFVLCNPSTADENSLDPTLKRCKAIASYNGYGQMVIVNLFSHVSTDPKNLDRTVSGLTIRARVAIAGMPRILAYGRIAKVDYNNFRYLESNMKGRCGYLDINKDGSYKHPLYVKKNTSFKWV